MNKNANIYQPKNHLRVVTAASLFDGHDAAINIIRRILQASGAEVIHLGHNRSVEEIVHCAIQEDVQAIAVTSYQGGHMEFFKFMIDLLKKNKCEHIKIFGGGGGVILPAEIKELEEYGVERIYHPDDGRKMGLQGMINDVLQRCDYPLGKDVKINTNDLALKDHKTIAGFISVIENFPGRASEIRKKIASIQNGNSPVVGITGTGGSGKSSLVDEFMLRFLADFENKTVAIISVDPSKRKTGGALLGDRIRMNSIHHPNIYMRSMATRQSNVALSKHITDVIALVKAARFDLIVLESSGIGQSDTEIVDHSDFSIYVMTPEYGAPSQLEKIDMLDFADMVVLNKFDKGGARDALQDVKKQYRRNHKLWESKPNEIPVYPTIASQFNEPGMDIFYQKLVELAGFKKKKPGISAAGTEEKKHIIPSNRVRYLSEISETIRTYNRWAEKQSDEAQKLQSIQTTLQEAQNKGNKELAGNINALYKDQKNKINPENIKILETWDNKVQRYKDTDYKYRVRNKEFKVQTHTESLSHLQIPKVSLPGYKSWGDILKWNLLENVPGEFPYTAGVFPFKRETEDPTRMFAGEGDAERTNKRFHYLSKGMPYKRLSTAFDSVTLYGENPHKRPDIYGKIGNSGVSISCLDDVKKLYSGFNLVDDKTSVSMTINGPAPIIAGYFMNAAIDQQCEIYIHENGLLDETQKKIKQIYKKKGMPVPGYSNHLPEGNDGLGLLLLGVTGDEILPRKTYQKIKADTLQKVRGTIQADILKEDQAQNTCIFSTDFSIRLMGDMQAYFIHNHLRNFYSVSVSGYHIAEAGANPVSHLAFTLSNGFTYVEYYLSRGLKIDDFAPNLSFFFSNGIDPEYSVVGRVARSIWAKAMKIKYKANERSQKLKYHIQTSGRSLHAQEIAFNDIRTTLQALYAVYDNCNSLHTNAYDEAITTPTEESVRRAMAIQMIINKEQGLAKNQNPLQGSFIIEELTRLVEEAVLMEFDRITERGGVLGAMETNYQRNKIQEESMYYETLKNEGILPIIGVNTFLSSKGSPTVIPQEITRATEQEKQSQIRTVEQFHEAHAGQAARNLTALQQAARKNENIFNCMMEAAKHCSIGQISHALYAVGGRYRRNM